MRRTRAAVLHEQPGKWQVEELEMDDQPRHGEVLVRMAHAGLCHSDEIASSNLAPVPLPLVGGHEGSGVVESVGPGVSGLAVGDHVTTIFIPACGSCRWCAVGMQNLCDRGGSIMHGTKADGTFRKVLHGVDVAENAGIGTFAEHSVIAQEALVKLPRELPLDVAALLSCGVPTGWGSAVNAGRVSPGDVVIVMGIGGVGANALQGAKHSGATRIIAVDLVAGKEDWARQFGATDFTTDIDEATELARSLTEGQGADVAILTIGEVAGEPIAQLYRAIRKAGTVVVTSQGSVTIENIPVNLFELSMYQKRIQGALYGMDSPRRSVPRLAEMYLQGQLKLDELITSRYRLEDINEGYSDMHAGRNIRGVIDFD